MSFGREADDLRGEELLRGAIAPQGLWLMFACFSAGTPRIFCEGSRRAAR